MQENSVAYVAGFVVKKLKKLIKCTECVDACLAEYAGAHPTASRLCFMKQRGGLIVPSKDVVDICVEAERQLSIQLQEKNVTEILRDKQLQLRITHRVMRNLNMNLLFPSLREHGQLQYRTSFSIDDDHMQLLIRKIIYEYVKIKKFHTCRNFNQGKKTHLRQKLSRLIIFQHQ